MCFEPWHLLCLTTILQQRSNSFVSFYQITQMVSKILLARYITTGDLCLEIAEVLAGISVAPKSVPRAL